MPNQKNIYTIPPEEDFLRSLATYIFNLVGGDVFELSKVRVILPNRRSVLKIREELVALSRNGAIILPQIFSLSELDETGLEIDSLMGEERYGFLPALSSEKRMFMLADMLLASAEKFGIGDINISSALLLAGSLGTLLDDMEKHELGIESMEKILPEELSKHRQISLDLIRYISEQYPKTLQDAGVTDSARRTNDIIKAYAKNLESNGSDNYIFIAGSTGSIPVTRRLIKTIANLPKGFVILPYTDMGLNSFEWEDIGNADNQISHQKNIYVLLRSLGIRNGDVKILSGAGTEKQKFITNMMRCASSLGAWKNYKASCDWIKLIKAENPLHEAKLISAVIRHKIEEKKSVALITNNKDLAEKVRIYLQRFGVHIDDSSGYTLDETDEGRLLVELAELISGGYRVTALVSVLKNKLLKISASEIENFEKNILRKNNVHYLNELFADRFKDSPLMDVVSKLYGGKDAPDLMKMINSLPIEIDMNENKNWQEIEKLLGNLEARNIEQGLLADCVKMLLAGKKIWPKYTPNQSVAILSAIEARLQHFDCVVLGDLTLGSWPVGKFSPWFSRNMFKSMELPFEEDAISLSAHDFSAHLHQKEVFITLSEYVGGEPAIESPFISRMRAFYKAVTDGDVTADDSYFDLVDEMNGNFVERKTVAVAMPKIPPEAQIKRLSVTKIESLIKNPYGVYASEVLKLRKLDELERELEARDYGTFVHKVLEEFSNAHKLDVNKIDIKLFEQVVDRTHEEFSAANLSNTAWVTQVKKLGHWFVEIEKENAPETKAVISETKAELDMGGFTLSCKADRIDVDKDNVVSIGDYKTGYFPNPTQVDRLIASQLPLTAFLVKGGAFGAEMQKDKLGNIVYYNFSFSKGGPEKKIYDKIELDEITEAVEAELKNLIDDLKNPDVPYLIRPNPKLQPDFDDYEHLERVEN